MAETTQINIKLPAEQKQDWEQYVSENEETTSLSHLIRLSVQREINRERNLSQDEPDSTTQRLDVDDIDVDIDVSSLNRRMTDVEETLGTLIEVVETIEADQMVDDELVEKIADKIFETMPTLYEETTDGVPISPSDLAAKELIPRINRQLDKGMTIEELAEDDEFSWTGWTKLYQEYYDIDNYAMQRALDRVDKMASNIHVIDDWEFRVVLRQDERAKYD